MYVHILVVCIPIKPWLEKKQINYNEHCLIPPGVLYKINLLSSFFDGPHLHLLWKLSWLFFSLQTQRDGLIFIYDMTNSSYGNFDYDLCVKILNLLKVNIKNILLFLVLKSCFGNGETLTEICLSDFCASQGAFPARLKCVFIVSSPLWFRAPFAVLRLFVREKLRERVCMSVFIRDMCHNVSWICFLLFDVFSSFCNHQVCTVKAHELASHIPVSSLPEHLGGTSQYSHVAWIQSCVNIHTNTVQGDTQEHDTHDCVGSLLRSYSLECGNTGAGTTLSHTHINTQLGSELAVANSNCYDDSNANPHNHCGVEGRTRGPGQYQQSPHSAANRPQGNHQHWNGSAVSDSSQPASVNANMNGRGRQAPPQSDTPPDTPLSHKVDGNAVYSKTTDSAHKSQNEGVKEQDEEEGGEEEEEEEGVPPLPQKSLPRPPHQPSSQSPPLSSSWDPEEEEERCMEVSVHMPEQGGMTVHELVEHVKRKKKKGIYQEYEEIRKEPPAGTFDYSK